MIGAETVWTSRRGRRWALVAGRRIEVITADELLAALNAETAPESAVPAITRPEKRALHGTGSRQSEVTTR